MIKNRHPFLLVGLFLAVSAFSGRAGADIVQPISVQLREQEPNTFLVQWKAPQNYPARAIPEPVLPEDCLPQGERLLEQHPGTWLTRQVYRCADPLTGREIGVRFPFVVAGQSTMMRVELLSGENLVHALNPGEDRWLVPELDAGLMANLWRNIQRAIVDGIRHFLGGWLHLAFWLVLALLGGASLSIRWVSAFSAGQLLAVASSTLFGVSLPSVLAESGLALAVMLLAIEVLKPGEQRRQVAVLCWVSGVVHGLGLGSLLATPASFSGTEWLYLLLAVLGMDATLLILVLVAPGFRHLAPTRSLGRALAQGLAYGLGVLSVAATMFLVLANPLAEAGTEDTQSRLPTLPGSESGVGMPGSRRVAAQGTQAPIQSFLSIEAFEVRHQILVRVRDLTSDLGLEAMEAVSIETQPDVKARLQEMALPMASVSIDGELGSPVVDRIDFLSVDAQGVLPRPEPVVELVNEAFLGITLVYVTASTPDRVDLTWNAFPEVVLGVPATASDPEFSETVVLTAEDRRSSWENNLSVDLIPTVAAVEIEPRELPIPLVALPFLAASIFFLVAGLRSGRSTTNMAWARVALALALLLSPVGEFAVALPSSFTSVPSTGQARRILAGVLPNVYRAFEFREESAAYDRLSVSVTGDTLSEIYLEHRRALEMEERGGARARVEAVEIEEVRAVRPTTDGGFDVDAVWVVGGTVTHFGHRHFRQNRYDASVNLVPVDNSWKIRTIELFGEERIR